MHAFLLIGGSPEARKKTAYNQASHVLKASPEKLLSHPDMFLIQDEKSITIAQVRLLKHWLSRTPVMGPAKAVLIENAHLLTPPAQHAILKILEEPTPLSTLVLTTPNANLLLDTIRSRCHSLYLANSPKIEVNEALGDLINKLKELSPGQRLILAQHQSKSRDQALDFCHSLLDTLRVQAREGKTLATKLQRVRLALVRLGQNANPKLVIENLFLSL